MMTFKRLASTLSAVAAIVVGVVPYPAAAQITTVDDLSDVGPSDWAYEALKQLNEDYGCLPGTPAETFGDGRAITRYEAAAGANACIRRIEDLLAGGATYIRPRDLETLRRLQDEFAAELATLGARVDSLEDRVANLEDQQFSTTTKLQGEVIFQFADEFEGLGLQGAGRREIGGTVIGDSLGNPFRDDDVTFGPRVRLNLDTSFTGEDRLRIRLDAETFKVNQNYFAANVPSNGADLALISPLGPAGPSGGGVRINDGGIGFADIQNLREEVTGRYTTVKLVARFPIGDLFTDPPAPQAESDAGTESYTFLSSQYFNLNAGVFYNTNDYDYSYQGQTAVFGGVPGLDFRGAIDYEADTFGVVLGFDGQFPLYRISADAALVATVDAEGYAGVTSEQATAGIWTTGAATIGEQTTIREKGVSFSGRAVAGFGIVREMWGLFLEGGFKMAPQPNIVYSPFGPAQLDSETETIFIGQIRTTFTF